MRGRDPRGLRWAQAALCTCTLAQPWQHSTAFVLPEMPSRALFSLCDFKPSCSSVRQCSQVLCPSSLLLGATSTHTAWPYLSAAREVGTSPNARWSSGVGRLRGGADDALGAVDDSSSSSSSGGTSSGTAGENLPAAVELPIEKDMRGGLFGLSEHDG